MKLIEWCSICNEKESNGTLEIIRDGETEHDFIQACLDCVRSIPKEDWQDEQE